MASLDISWLHSESFCAVGVPWEGASAAGKADPSIFTSSIHLVTSRPEGRDTWLGVSRAHAKHTGGNWELICTRLHLSRSPGKPGPTLSLSPRDRESLSACPLFLPEAPALDHQLRGRSLELHLALQKHSMLVTPE